MRRTQNQYDQAPRGLRSPCRLRQWLVPDVPGAGLSTSLANAAAALAAVLGSGTVEMPVTQSSIIHGSRASRLVKVGWGGTWMGSDGEAETEGRGRRGEGMGDGCGWGKWVR